VIVALLAIFGLALFRSGLQQDRNRRMALRASTLSAIAVPVLQLNKVIGGTVVQYQYGWDKRQKPLVTTSRFGKNESPLWLEEDGTMALAVMPERGTTPVLLDSELERLDLTPSERADIMARLQPAPVAS